MGEPVRFRKRNGLSLLEVIMVLGLLSVLMVSLFLFLGGSLFSISRSESIQQATSLAQEQIEQIKQGRIPVQEGVFDGSVPTPQTLDFPPPPYPGDTRGRPYTLKVEVVRQSPRLYHLKVSTSDGERDVVSVETILKK